MNDNHDAQPPAFGVVNFDAEHGVFTIDTTPGGTCRLTLMARTERGYPRRELAALPGAVWKIVASAVQKELLRGMDAAEHGDKPIALRSGGNALNPLILRELALLLWALMEDADGTHLEALLNGWRQLAREERWWLYARASNPAQRQGHGWRRALFFALADPASTNTAPRLLEIIEAATTQKRNALDYAAQRPEGSSSEEETTSAPAGAVSGAADAEHDRVAEGMRNAASNVSRQTKGRIRKPSSAAQLNLL